MVDVAPEAWTKEVEDARAALRRRMPDLRRLRRDADTFFFRLWPDETFVPGSASESGDRGVELIRRSCGFQEKHVVRLLAAVRN